MNKAGRMPERDPVGRGLRFEKREGDPGTSGHHGQKRRGRKPAPGTGPEHSRDAHAGSPRSEEREDIPPTSGQDGQKPGGGKFRRDSARPRPSDRFRQKKGKAPKWKKAAREDRRYEKAGRRVDKTGAKLDKARDTLAKQKPSKRPGPVKTAGRALGHQAWTYAHKKINEVERENVGVEAAHKAELAGEKVIGGGVRFIKHRIRTRPARQVRKWERKNIRARADHEFRRLAREHPELKQNAFSRHWQKRKLKKQYQKQARETARQSAKAAKKTAAATGRIARAALLFVKRHPVVILLLAAVFLLLMLLQSCMGAGLSIANGLAGGIGGSSYLAEDADINEAELAYTQWEADLTLEARNAEQSHPGYDEYRYSIDPTGHDPYMLLAFLTAKYDDFTFAEIEPVLRDIFDQQYSLTFTEIVEVRYRTEYYTDEDGDEHSYEVPYNYYILEVELTARPFADVIGPMLTTQDEQDRYDVYNVTKGNRQYVGSPFPFNWLPYVSCPFGYRVHPITGERDFHRAVDIALPAGTEIHAGGEGVVVEATSHSLYGQTMKIDYGGGVTARYSHCAALLVSAGQTVETGDVIALVGSTGESTGPHLDLEVMKDGELLNHLYFVVIPMD